MDDNENLQPLRFKVHKKMKTRKQLDAMIERRKRQRSGGESAYLIESSCSDFEEFDASKNRLWARERSCRCLSFCATALNVIFLAASVITCAALIWVYIGMKTKMDNVDQRIQSVEVRSVNQEEMDGFIWKIKRMESTVDSLRENMTIIMTKVSQLEQTTTELGEKFQSSSQLVDLPKEVENLKKNVAGLGATKLEFELIHKQTKEALDKLQLTVNRLELTVNSSIADNEELTTLRNITSLLKQLEDKYSHNLNNNLLNPETTKGIEEVMKKTIEQYYTENNFDLNSIQLGLNSVNSSVQALWNVTGVLSMELKEISGSRGVVQEERTSTITTRQVDAVDEALRTSPSIVPSGPLPSSVMSPLPVESHWNLTAYTPEEEFRKWFVTLDTNKDSVLSESEIRTNLIPETDSVQLAVELAGKNVTFNEFVDLVKALSKQTVPAVEFEDPPMTHETTAPETP